MAATQAGVVLCHLRALAAGPDERTPDDQLLQRFAATRDGEAFEALLRRHGPMVLGVCRRLLRREQDVEDVFQATFLVLARKAASIRRPQSVAAWLHGVARRIAVKVRAAAARQAVGPVPEVAAPDLGPAGVLTWHEVRGALDEELTRLPEALRAPLVLCYLQGLTRDEAAARLRCPLGTLKGRLERGRDLLRQRLTRRGLALSAVLAALALERAAVPATLAAATARASFAFAAGVPGSSAAVALAEAALRDLTGIKFRAGMALLLGLTVLAAGTALSAQPLPPQAAPAAQAEAGQGGRARNDAGGKADAQGDPLPPGAVTRLGTVRYRFPGVGAAFLPDGKTVVSVGQEGNAIKLWDARTGRLVREIDTGNFITRGGVALARDGSHLAVSGSIRDDTQPSWRSAVRVFDLATGKDARTVERPPLEGVNALTLSPDGKLLFTLDRNGKLRIEEVATGTELLRQQFPGDVMAALAMSPDGSTVALGSGPNTHKILVWRWEAGEEPRAIQAGPYRARDLVFSPDGKWIAECSDDAPDVRIWDVAGGRLLHKLELPDHEPHRHYQVAFSPDGIRLAAYGGSKDGYSVHLWDPATGQFVKRLDKRLDMGGGALAFSPDSKLLVSGSHAWDLAASKELSANSAAHSAFVQEIVTSAKDIVVTAGADDTVRIWDAATGKHLHRLTHGSGVGGIALSHDGRLLVSSSLDDTVCLWDVATGKRIYRLAGHGELGTSLRPVVFTSDDKAFLTWGADMYLRKWDVRTGKAVAEYLMPPPGVRVPSEDDEPFPREREAGMFDLGAARFTPDGRHLVLQAGASWSVFDAATGWLQRTFPSADGVLIATTTSPDSKLLLATAHGRSVPIKLPDGTTQFSTPKGHRVALWDLTTGRLRKEVLLPEEGAGPVAFSPDGAWIAVASSRPGSRIRVLDATTGREVRKIDGRRSVVHSLAFMPDGKRLVSGMEDSTALIWDLTR
jgi:RNA polymerase sigma factor (sigma-70 family)